MRSSERHLVYFENKHYVNAGKYFSKYRLSGEISRLVIAYDCLVKYANDITYTALFDYFLWSILLLKAYCILDLFKYFKYTEVLFFIRQTEEIYLGNIHITWKALL